MCEVRGSLFLNGRSGERPASLWHSWGGRVDSKSTRRGGNNADVHLPLSVRSGHSRGSDAEAPNNEIDCAALLGRWSTVWCIDKVHRSGPI